MAAVKPLHLAKCLEELNKKVDKSEKVKSSTPKMLCRLAEKMLLKAKDELLRGDEESAYILYMRFIDMYKIVHSSKEFKKDKTEFVKVLPTSKVNTALDNAEKLAASLKARYSKLNSEPTSESEPSSSTEDQVVPASPKPHPSSLDEESPLSSVTPVELYKLLTQQPDNVLVLDCRPRAEFLTSHPDTKKRFPQWLCVPQEIVGNGVVDKMVAFLSVEGKKRWQARANISNIVLTDDHSTMESLSQHKEETPILALREALRKDPPLTSDPCVLEGGYAKWYLTYGVTCVGAYRKKGGGASSGGVASTSQEGSANYPEFPKEIKEVTEKEPEAQSSSDEGEEPSMDTQPVTPYQNAHTTPTSQQIMAPMPTPQGFPQQGPAPPFMGMAPPLPLPPSSIPVALSLEGEDGLIAPTLTSEHDLLSDYPQILMAGRYEEEEAVPMDQANVPADIRPFTEQPSQGPFTHQQPPQNTAGGHPVAMTTQNAYNVPSQMPPQNTVQAPPTNHTAPSQQFQQVPSNDYGNQGQPHPPQGHYQQVSGSDSGGSIQYQNQSPQTSRGHILETAPQQQHTGQSHQMPPQNFGGQTQQQFGVAQHPQQQGPSMQQYSPPSSTQYQQPGGQQNLPPPATTQAPPTTHPGTQQHHYPPSQAVGGQIQQSPPQMIQTSPQQTQPQAPPSHPVPAQQAPPTSNYPATVQTPSGANVATPTGAVHQSNSRVAVGPIPQPPTYDQAITLPSLPPTSEPLPPPVSVSAEQLIQQSRSGSSVVSSSSVESATQSPPQTAVRSDTGALYQAPGGGPVISGGQQPSAPGKSRAEQEALDRLNEETKKVQELKSQMQSEISRMAEVRAQQEAATKQQAEREAQWEAKRQDLARNMQQERMELEKQRKQYEQMMGSMVAEKQRYLQMQEAEKRSVQGSIRQGSVRPSSVGQDSMAEQHKEWAQRAGLPRGWEKRLDHRTGRYYYVDHSTQTTHWNPPLQLIDYQRQQEEASRRAQEAARRNQGEAARRAQDEAVRRAQGEAARRAQFEAAKRAQDEAARTTLAREAAARQAQLTQQNQVPIATPGQQTAQTTPINQGLPAPSQNVPPSKPVVDRTVKPTPAVDRSKKPNPALWTSAEIQEKEASLQPIFGAERQLLTGLRNIGNTCFMNSTLQCLSHTSPVMPYFTSLRFQRDINYSNPIGHKGAVAKEFSWLIRALWSGRYKSVTPRDFKNMVDQYIPTMQGHAQQDAQEFLAFLMNGLHEDLNRVQSRVQIADLDSTKLDEPALAKLTWSNHIKRNNSIIVEYFQGMYRSSVTCTHCRKRSVTFEPFMYLSLPIPPGQGAYTLQDCLNLFSEQETVAWKCSGCHHSAGAVKKIEIWKLPVILLIALSRFSYDGLWKEKRQNYIDYPTGKSLLNLAPFVVGERPRVGYRLFAVSNHFGTQSGGHYTACCLNPFTQTYYNFDDHEVSVAKERQIKSGAGYLLFYTSLDHQPPKAKF